jgi:hypothetical protein
MKHLADFRSMFKGKQVSSIVDEIASKMSSSKMTSEEKRTLKLGIGRIPEIVPDTLTVRYFCSPFTGSGSKSVPQAHLGVARRP